MYPVALPTFADDKAICCIEQESAKMIEIASKFVLISGSVILMEHSSGFLIIQLVRGTMLSQQEELQQKWGGRSSAIDQWLEARKTLLIRYCALAKPDKNATTEQRESDIVEFCNLLMDYLSAGHFEIYDMLISEDASGQRLRQQSYPKLARTTDYALRFQDRYAVQASPQYTVDFTADLAELGETLETRFALEDKLIHHMLEHYGGKQIQHVHQQQADVR